MKLGALDKAAMTLALEISRARRSHAWQRASDFREALALGGAACRPIVNWFDQNWDSGGWGAGADEKQIPHANEMVREAVARIRKVFQEVT